MNCENLVVLDVDIILSKCYNITWYIICSCLYHYSTWIMTRFVQAAVHRRDSPYIYNITVSERYCVRLWDKRAPRRFFQERLMAENDITPVGIADGENSEDGMTASERAPAPKKKRSAKKQAAVFFIKVGVTALAVWILLTFVAGVHVCHENNAYPAIRDGEFCMTYRLAEPKAGAMIVYRQNGKARFGRVIAVSGEKVTIFNDYITVDDYGISENAVYPTSPEGSAISYPYIVPDKCVFVMNDFRSDISDSRTFGGIPLDDVEGAVVFTMRMRGI